MITHADLRAIPMFAGLSDAQLDELLDAADESLIVPGEVQFVEGEHADYWWVLLDGALELVRRISRFDPTHFRIVVADPETVEITA